MGKMRPMDDNGWMVPREGTKSRMVYGLLKAGLKATAMQAFMPSGTTVETIRVLICKIKHPKPTPVDRPRYTSAYSPPSR